MLLLYVMRYFCLSLHNVCVTVWSFNLLSGHWDLVPHGSDTRHGQTHQAWRGKMKGSSGRVGIKEMNYILHMGESWLSSQLRCIIWRYTACPAAPIYMHCVNLHMHGPMVTFHLFSWCPRFGSFSALGAPLLHNCIALHVLLQVRSNSHSPMWNIYREECSHFELNLFCSFFCCRSKDGLKGFAFSALK